jgi:hypothetical protein
VADWVNDVIRSVSPSGEVGTAIGHLPEINYLEGPCKQFLQNLYEGDGGTAGEAGFGRPTTVTIAGDGSIYVGDIDDQVVRRLTPEGTMPTAVGFYEPAFNEVKEVFQFGHPEELACRYTTYTDTSVGWSGIGGAATSATIGDIKDIAAGPDGTLYISGDDQVFKVDPSTGVIEHYAGNGVEGFSGDGGPATSAELRDPSSIAVGPDGSLYIGDLCNGVIRRVDGEGTITTVAGDGKVGHGAYEVDATEAAIGEPNALAVDPLGNLYFYNGKGEIAKADAPLGPGVTDDSGGNICESEEKGHAT